MRTKPRIRHLNDEHREWIISQIVSRKKYKDIGAEFVTTFPKFAPLVDSDEIANVIGDRCKDIARLHKKEINKRSKRKKPAAMPAAISSTTETTEHGVPANLLDVKEQESLNSLCVLKKEVSRLERNGEYTHDKVSQIERTRKSLYERLDAIKKEKLEAPNAFPAGEESWLSTMADMSEHLVGGKPTPEDEARFKEMNRQARECFKELDFSYGSSGDMHPWAIRKSVYNALYGMEKDEREAKKAELRLKYPLLFPPDDPSRRGCLKQDKDTVKAARENSADDTAVAVQQGDESTRGTIQTS